VATRTEEGVEVPKLKRAFHLVCKGCHESLKLNQPDTIAPTDCESCHTDRGLKRLSGTLSLERAFHLSCVSCHQKVQLAKADTKAPAEACGGCHTEPIKSSVMDDSKVPITTVNDDVDKGKEKHIIDHAKKAKSGTPFAHHVHQHRAPNCNKCHHRGLEDPTCRECHKDVKGAKKAYHKACIDCHKANKGPRKCVVCHP
jgi:hypothetical protein